MLRYLREVEGESGRLKEQDHPAGPKEAEGDRSSDGQLQMPKAHAEKASKRPGEDLQKLLGQARVGRVHGGEDVVGSGGNEGQEDEDRGVRPPHYPPLLSAGGETLAPKGPGCRVPQQLRLPGGARLLLIQNLGLGVRRPCCTLSDCQGQQEARKQHCPLVPYRRQLASSGEPDPTRGLLRRR